MIEGKLVAKFMFVAQFVLQKKTKKIIIMRLPVMYGLKAEVLAVIFVWLGKI